MMTLKTCKTGIASATIFSAMFVAGSAFAATGNKVDYTASKDRISAEYKADKNACDGMSGNKKDICVEQAKSKEKVAKAEAEYTYTGKPGDHNKVAVAKADGEYAVAKEMCDDKAGNDKDVCKTEAKSAHSKAVADAKMSKKVGEARKDAAEERRDADYKVASEKCDALAGDAKNACMSAAKSKYNKN